MTVNYTVRANVVDIRWDKPKPRDNLLVDSNVWYWHAYPNARYAAQPPKSYQITYYPTYIIKAAAGANLFYNGLSLSEVGHLIEKVEHFIFDPSGLLRNKEFRHNFPVERNNVVKQIRRTWAKVERIAAPIEAVINQPAIGTALTRLATTLVDTYDLFLLEAATNAGITQILTDDGDFATVAGIELFTANLNVIDAARTQRKLINR